ncbi:RICIN domain-containing protein [Haloarchaeobius sp. DYHT-AS-18]|uniref:RICIN domain-containing protein n=1 Tax=Haloarchaeobius sp. DYHT-AS-18 TaxID=3446117 RepID=UPI003EB9B177
MTGLTAFSGSAAATSPDKTPGTFCDLGDVDAPSSFPMIENKGTGEDPNVETTGNFPEGPSELTIYIGGWHNYDEEAAFEAKYRLDQENYPHPVVGYKWEADGWWMDGMDASKGVGRILGDWLDGYMDTNPDTDINIIGHGMGARASLTCLEELRQQGKKIQTLALFGAAVDADACSKIPEWGIFGGDIQVGEWYGAVDNAVESAYNFYSLRDGFLGKFYGDMTLDLAMGHGTIGDTPSNLEEIDVTDVVSSHCGYSTSQVMFKVKKLFEGLPLGIRTIDEEIYKIINVRSGKALDVADFADDNGSNIHTWDYHGGENQKWKVEYQGDGKYSLIAQHSGKVADVAGFSTDRGGNIHQWEWNGNDAENQKWEIHPQDSGDYRIVNEHSGMVMQVPVNSTENGENVEQMDWFDYANQRWRIRPTGKKSVQEGEYKIVNVKSGKVLDIENLSDDNGANLHQMEYSGGANQRWQVDYLGDSQYRFVAKHSDKVFDVKDESKDNGKTIHQWEWEDDANQKWYIDPLGDDEFRIRNVNSNKVVDVEGASTGDGADIQQYDWHGGDNQRWKLVFADQKPIEEGLYKIVNVNSEKVLDIDGTSSDEGTNILQWGWADAPWQKWHIDYLGDGEYRMVNDYTNKVVDVEDTLDWFDDYDNDLNGTTIHQWGWHGGDSQRWYFYDVGDDEYRIRNANSNKVLEVEDYSTSSGGDVQQYDWRDNVNQRWRLVRLE